jgi:hypothetical protein
LYSLLLKANKPFTLSIFKKNGHKFEMTKEGLPNNLWIAPFYDGLITERARKNLL